VVAREGAKLEVLRGAELSRLKAKLFLERQRADEPRGVPQVKQKRVLPGPQ
jgi:hypothetical protein